jgi:hypothetical protein
MAATTRQTSGKRCAAMLCGRRVLVEYQTGRDDDGPFVNVLAVHAGDWRITADRFSEDQIADLERECEAAEMAASADAWGLPDAEPAQIQTRGMYAVARVTA